MRLCSLPKMKIHQGQPVPTVTSTSGVQIMKRFLVLLAAVPLALAGCTAIPGAAPVETVTVTATPTPVATATVTATPAPVGEPGDSEAQEPVTGQTMPQPRDPSEHPPFGLIIYSAEKICVPPVHALPDLVNSGDSPEFVDALEMALYLLGYDVGFSSTYDSNTVEVVKRAQRDLGVVPDGQVGPITWGAIRDRHCPEWEEYFSDQGTSGGNGSTYEIKYEGVGYALVDGSYATSLGFNSGQWFVLDDWVKTVTMSPGDVASLSFYYSTQSNYNRPLTCRIYVNGTLKAESTTRRGGTAYCEYPLP